ncbi:hypothetical protein [Paraglaciecola sp.]
MLAPFAQRAHKNRQHDYSSELALCISPVSGKSRVMPGIIRGDVIHFC